MQALKIIGPYRGPTGYDHLVREFVRELLRLGCAVELRQLDGWGPEFPPEMREPLFENLEQPVAARVVLHFCMPHQVTPDPNLPNVNFTMFEGGRIPGLWVKHGRTHDLIIVPTENLRRAWIGCGVPAQRIEICPLGIHGAAFQEARTPLTLPDEIKPLTDYKFRFLNIAELRPRKNHAGLLRAWLRATTPADDAVLILKLGCYDQGSFEDFMEDVQQLQIAEGRNLAGAAPIVMIRTVFQYQDLLRLYAAATHYINLSFGEGWDLPMMEAAASGLQCIACEFSAALSFLNRTDAHWIPVREIDAARALEGRLGRGDRIFLEGVTWQRPDETAAAQTIRAIIDGELANSDSPGARIRADFSWTAAARRLSSILERW